MHQKGEENSKTQKGFNQFVKKMLQMLQNYQSQLLTLQNLTNKIL